MYKLYDFLPSGNSYKVRLLLNLLDITYERINVNTPVRETRTPEFLAKNPNGKIPLLEIAPDQFWRSLMPFCTILVKIQIIFPPRNMLKQR